MHFQITDKDREQTLATTLESLEPLKLKILPRKEKRKYILLIEIAKQFTAGQSYTEKEVNQILKGIYPDFATIRRYLVDYKFLERTDNGSLYKLKG